jgi:hypothetical protein
MKEESSPVYGQHVRFSEADLAKSARADREASNRFGLAFRERQKETFRYLLEREEREDKRDDSEAETKPDGEAV